MVAIDNAGSEMAKFVLTAEQIVADGSVLTYVKTTSDEDVNMVVENMNHMLRAIVAVRDVYANEQLRRLG